MEKERRSRLHPGEEESSNNNATPRSLERPISPPTKRRRLDNPNTTEQYGSTAPDPTTKSAKDSRKYLKSPFQLTRIWDLPPEDNVDTITLKDILADPLMSQLWEFNYLHDIDFLMSNLDEDVMEAVDVHVVHGFWKRTDSSRPALLAGAARYSNVTLHQAYLPEMFGTHHSKMMIIFRRDGTAQVVIHTANMIPQDWRNMTQAVWRSPWLPLLRNPPKDASREASPYPAIGSGEKFKLDLLSYLEAYDVKRATCKRLRQELAKYDFSAVRGALVASVPGNHGVNDDGQSARWGWAAMGRALQNVPIRSEDPEIVVQISSIAMLGPTDDWLRNTLFKALSSGSHPASEGVSKSSKPRFRVMFPTASEIRKSLDGYVSGGSIHTKIQSPQQAKQLQYLKPIFCHWGNDSEDGAKLDKDATIRKSGRRRAAPHIKTYIRYSNGGSTIDWALLTSANLSKQAWGGAAGSSGEMRVQSYEIGVLVWPSLLGGDDAVMVPTFRTDDPSSSSFAQGVVDEDEEKDKTVIGLRAPYDMPLQKYSQDEIPWVSTLSYDEPDWRGQTWGDG